MTKKTATSRLTKEERALAEAERLASLLAMAPAVNGEPLSPPAFINDPRLAPALAVWRDLAQQLADTGRLHALDRMAFAALCYWHAEWIAGVDDVATRGYAFMAKATAGGKRPWTNPSVGRRDTAWAQIMALMPKFGLTPLDRIALNKNRGMIRDDEELPLGPPAAQPDSDVQPSKWTNLIGRPN